MPFLTVIHGPAVPLSTFLHDPAVPPTVLHPHARQRNQAKAAGPPSKEGAA